MLRNITHKNICMKKIKTKSTDNWNNKMEMSQLDYQGKSKTMPLIQEIWIIFKGYMLDLNSNDLKEICKRIAQIIKMMKMIPD